MTAEPIDWVVPGILGGLAAVLLAMAAAFAVFYSFLAGTVERVEAWPKTEAVVTVNKITIMQGPKLNTTYPLLTLEYTYEVAGRSYTGKNVNVDRTAVTFVDTDYPVGSRMPVRYDPADPSIVGVGLPMAPAMTGRGLVYLAAGIAAVGLLLAFIAIRSYLRQRGVL